MTGPGGGHLPGWRPTPTPQRTGGGPSGTARDRVEPGSGYRTSCSGSAGAWDCRTSRLDVFDSTAALAAHWSGLLESAAIESLTAPTVRTPAARARALAERVEQADLLP